MELRWTTDSSACLVILVNYSDTGSDGAGHATAMGSLWFCMQR
jgi:hypothetical protein